MQRFFEQHKIEDEVIAAGVSGGADSLALVLRLNDWAKQNGRRIVALTVEHGLRSESAAEAEYVAQLMAGQGIEHHILPWVGQKPKTGIEEAARKARYDLLAEWCKAHNVRVLAMGHHLRDQAETFLLRLIRGSGVYGLSGILPVSERGGLLIVRPQLDKTPDELRGYLRERGVRWVEDPSNQNQDFLRVKIRRFLPELERELGLTEGRLAATAAVLAQTRAFVESEVQKVIKNQVCVWEQAGVSFKQADFGQWPQEIKFHILAELLAQVGQRDYMPEAAEVLRLAEAMANPDFKGATLGGCEVLVFQRQIWLVPEADGSSSILRKKDWEEFVARHPQYAKISLPYKLRRKLVQRAQAGAATEAVGPSVTGSLCGVLTRRDA